MSEIISLNSNLSKENYVIYYINFKHCKKIYWDVLYSKSKYFI